MNTSGPFEFGGPEPTQRKPSILGPLILLIVAPIAILVVLVVVILLILANTATVTVYAVNGLKEPYEVTINGEQMRLSPGVAKKLVLKDSSLEVEVLDPGLEISRETHTLKTSFADRLLGNKIWVVNPDRLALLEWEEAEYAIDWEDGTYHNVEYYTAKPLYEFERIEYPFEKMPDEIDMPAAISSLKKRRVDYAEGLQPSDALVYAFSWDEEGDLRGYINRVMKYYPEDEDILLMGSIFMEDEEFTEIITPLAEQRPVDVYVHEIYQDHMEGNYAPELLEQRYQEILDEDPENRDAIYLLARVTRDYEKSNALLLQAVKAPNPSLEAALEIGRRLMTRGEFERALQYIVPVFQKRSEDYDVTGIWRTAALGNGQYLDVVDQLTQEAARDDYLDLDYLEQRVLILARAGQEDRARKLIADTRKTMVDEYGEETADWYDVYLEAMIAYGAGNIREYVRKYSELEDAEYDWTLAVHSGDLKKAQEIMYDYGDEEPATYLALFAAARLRNEEVIAKDALRLAVEAAEWYEDMEPYSDLIAMLQGKKVPSIEDIQRLDLMPYEKRSVALALGIIYPGIRQEAFALARKLNVEISFPYYVIQEATGGSP